MLREKEICLCACETKSNKKQVLHAVVSLLSRPFVSKAGFHAICNHIKDLYITLNFIELETMTDAESELV